MGGAELPGDGTPLSPARLRTWLRSLLDEARDVSVKSRDRIRRLAERYPSDVSPYLLDDLDPTRTDRRVGVRLSGGRERVRLRVETSVVSARLLDRSPGGLRLELWRPVPEGTAVSVRVPVTGDLATWRTVVVRHCRPSGRRWQAGCEYTTARPVG